LAVVPDADGAAGMRGAAPAAETRNRCAGIAGRLRRRPRQPALAAATRAAAAAAAPGRHRHKPAAAPAPPLDRRPPRHGADVKRRGLQLRDRSWSRRTRRRARFLPESGVHPVEQARGLPMPDRAAGEVAQASDLGAPAEVRQAARELLPLFYDEVRRLAQRERRRAGAARHGDETLQTTALIHEAYLRMRGSAGFNDHAHYLRAAAV